MLEDPASIRSVYQPVVALATGRVVGYEALARVRSDPPRPVGTWFAEANGCGWGAALEAAAITAALEPFGRPPGPTWRSTSAPRP